VTTEERRLAAIVSADIAGYSRLIGKTRVAPWRASVGTLPNGPATAPWPSMPDTRTPSARGVLFSF
jgi:hypothetical protein